MPAPGTPLQGNVGTAVAATSMTLGFPNPVVPGNLLVAAMHSSNTVGAGAGVSDNVNGAYAVANNHSTGNSSNDAGIWYKENTAAGTPTVTLTPFAQANIGGAIEEYSGVLTASSLDKNGATDANLTNAVTSGSLTNTGANGDLLVGTTGSQLQNSTVSTPTAGWALDQNNTPSAITDIMLGSRIQAVAAAFTVTFNFSGTPMDVCCVVASFKLAAAAPATTLLGPRNLPVTARPGTPLARRQTALYLMHRMVAIGVAAATAAWRDASGRFLLQAGATRDALGRFLLAVAGSTATIVSSATLGRVAGATGGTAQNHLVYAKNTGRWWFFTYKGNVDSGTATSGSTSALNDTGKAWTAGQYLGYACVITGGTGAGQWFTIGNNTATSLPVVDNGATGSWLATALAAGSTYEIVEATRIRAYVSSGADLSTATWAEATGSPAPSISDGGSLGLGINLAGGKNNPGGYGEFPTDGRLLAIGYGDVGGVDVIYAVAQQDSHYIHTTLRARLTAATTVVWDANVHGGGGGSNWNDGAPGIEDAPDFPQGLAIGISSTSRWWWVNEENFQSICGYAAGVVDNGAANQDPTWAGNNGGSKPTTWDSALNSIGAPWQSAVVPLASGFMLAVYGSGVEDTSTPHSGNTHQAGLRFAESASATQWPTSSTAGAAVPNLSTASNHPNDWAICRVSDTDIHLVRRNSGTTLEHVRYSGHGGSWGSKVNLPTSGLTGQQAGSGLGLVTDGTNVWCFLIDTDANHTIRYAKWNGTSWDTSWTQLSTNSNAKDFLTCTMGSNRIGVAWTEGTGPYSVVVSSLSLLSGTTAWRDALGRFRMQATAWRDSLGRVRLMVGAFRDAAGRTRLIGQGWRDAPGRTRLQATGFRDALGRTRLAVASWRDSVGRTRLLAAGFRDGLGRTRLAVSAIRDSAGRARLLATGFRDAFGRVRIQVLGLRDTAGRMRLAVASVRDAAGRTRLLANGWRDAAGRMRLAVAAIRDAAGRVRIQVAAIRDAAGRTRLQAPAIRDAAGRMRLAVAGTAIRDALGRTRLAVGSIRDSAGRIRLLAAGWRDAAGRMRLVALGQGWRDGLGRVRIRATGFRDSLGRVFLGVLAFRDARGRLRLQAPAWRDALGRVRISVASIRDAGGRVRLVLAGWRDAAGRTRLLSAGARNAQGRFNLYVAAPGPIMHSPTRVRLLGDGGTRVREVK